MTIEAPRNYGPLPVLGLTAESDGYVTTCACKWLHWWPTQGDAATGQAAHQKKCKRTQSEASA